MCDVSCVMCHVSCNLPLSLRASMRGIELKRLSKYSNVPSITAALSHKPRTTSGPCPMPNDGSWVSEPQYGSTWTAYPRLRQMAQTLKPNRIGFPRINCFALWGPENSPVKKFVTTTPSCYTRHGTRDTGHTTRDTRHGTRDTGHATRDTRHGTHNTGHSP